MESRFLKIKREWYDIKELIEQVIDQLNYKSGNHQLVLSASADPPLVFIDFRLMQQTVLNLVNNAIQYTPPQTTFLISAIVEGEQLIITGRMMERKGIFNEDQDKIFNKFFRRAGTAAGGTGLGLSIVKGYAKAHGGRANVENSHFHGAKFIISIPVYFKMISEKE